LDGLITGTGLAFRRTLVPAEALIKKNELEI
jgi:hypothetical protein